MKVRMTIVSSIIMLVLIAALATRAQALAILESEPNDSLAGAQNIDGFFSLGANANIANPTTIPWVSIDARAGSTSLDYYSFTVQNVGDTGFFDIDFGVSAGGSIDTELGLWDPSGNVIDANDDSNTALGAGGSSSFLDSWIQHPFTTTGLHVIGVAEFPATPSAGGWIGGVPDQNDTYTLQVSLQNASIPEPSTMILLGIGLVGLAGVAARRKKKAVEKT